MGMEFDLDVTGTRYLEPPTRNTKHETRKQITFQTISEKSLELLDLSVSEI